MHFHAIGHDKARWLNTFYFILNYPMVAVRDIGNCRNPSRQLRNKGLKGSAIAAKIESWDRLSRLGISHYISYKVPVKKDEFPWVLILIVGVNFSVQKRESSLSSHNLSGNGISGSAITALYTYMIFPRLAHGELRWRPEPKNRPC